MWDDRLIRIIALLALFGVAPKVEGGTRPGPAPCGVKVRLPPGWTVVGESAFRGSCEVELRPPHWTSDSDCPERYSGRLFLRIVAKRLETWGTLRKQEWLQAEPVCDSGWSAGGEMHSCLHSIGGRKAALSTETSVRLYCNGTYAALDEGAFGVVFGEKRLAFVRAEAGDQELFDQVVASLQP